MLLAIAPLCASLGFANAAPVGPALERPAVQTRLAARSLLLGAALAGPRIVAVGERGIALWSDDSGVTWQQAQVPVSVTLTAVRFADAKTGWATGHGGVVLATRDGGQTWLKQLDGHAAARLALASAQASGDAAAIKEAQRLVADGADKPFMDLHFFDTRRGLVVGAYNLAFATDDGGQTWSPIGQRLDNPKALHLYAVRARGDQVLLAGEQGLVLKSTDGARSFTRLATPYRGSFFSAELLPADELLLAGLRGHVLRSRDGGVSWTAMEGGGPSSVTASALAADGRLWLVNQAGATLLAGRDRITPLPASAPVAGASAVLPLPDGRLLVLGARGATVLPGVNKDAGT